MAEGEKMIPIGETHETPQAITITIMDPSALGTPNIASSIVTSVEPQNTTGTSTSGNCNLLMVSSSGEQEPKSSILQTVTETHMGTEELPIISSISNPDHDESAELETKISQTLEGMEESEMTQEEPNEPVGQHCLICNIDIEPNEAEEDEEQQQQQQVPVFKSLTTNTNRRISIFLGGLVGQKLTSRKAHSDIMCRRCFNLLDRVDSLEVEIKETKEEIVNKYQETLAVHGGRARRRKPATARKSEYVFPKVEPEDEDDQMLGLETDGTFEPRLEDLMEEEHDRREDINPDDDEWEPEFKRTRIKREIDMDSGVPPKRKRGRPRKDATRPKVFYDDDDGPLSFEIVDDATSRGKTLLVDNRGYTYTKGKETPKGVLWRCSIRNTKTYCKATVRQRGYLFLPGGLGHCHTPETSALTVAKAFSRINQEVKARPLEPPGIVAKEIITTEFPEENLNAMIQAKLIRRAKYHRRSLQPKNIKMLVDEEPAPWTFEVVEDATKRGKPRLLDSRGYSYTQAKGTSTASVWRCTIRNDKVYCRATVRQNGFVFICGQTDHCHAPDVNALSKAKFLGRLNKEARARPHESAASIVKKVLASEFSTESPGPIKLANLIRSVNYQRRAARPKDPSSLEFELNESAIPQGFLQADIFIAGKRHLIFTTPTMASLLSKARGWYCDARYSIVARPFEQLFSIHVFVKSGSSSKQVPMVFVLMSERRKEDYVAVLLKILELMPCNPHVHSITLDFEATLWAAASEILPTVRLYGCHFSFNQIVWQKIIELELVPSYHNSESTQKFCRQVMALPFLPVSEIPTMFVEFTESTEDSSQCYKDLVNFVKFTWLENPLWPPPRWSAFKRPIRTKNDFEGWLKRLTHKASKRNMGFYQLITLLFKESFFDESQVYLVSEEEQMKCQRAKYSRLQAKIFEHWECFGRHELSPLDLLNHVALFNGPDTGTEPSTEQENHA